MAIPNEAAATLLNTIHLAPALTEEAKDALSDAIYDALAAERRATVERIRHAVLDAGRLTVGPIGMAAILDEEAER